MDENDKRRLAELETAQARAALDQAEFQRDAVAGVAVNEVIHRSIAEDAASNANMRAATAESRERSAATSAGLARQDARYERAAASNATFSATLIGVVAVALVLAVVGYFAWWQPNHAVNAATGSSNTLIRTDKTTEKAAAPSTVIVNPPDVNVKVNVPPSPQPAESSAEKAPASDTQRATDIDHPAAPTKDSDESKSSEPKSGTDDR